MNTIRRNVTPPQNDLLDEGHLHFRLCHLCFHLNEADAEINQCSECQHIFKDEILTQFFDNEDFEAFTDSAPQERVVEVEDEEGDRSKFTRDVNGLSVRF